MPGSKTVFCSQCGERLAANARFCSGCGAPVPGGAAGGEVESLAVREGFDTDRPPLDIGSKTDIGRTHSVNEDSIGTFRVAGGQWTLLVVCDGVGGSTGGRVASALAVETVAKVFQATIETRDPGDALRESIEESNRVIHSRGQHELSLARMGTTVAVLATDGERVYIAHVGDSRVYRIRGHTMEQLTRDHSTVQRMVDEGLMTAEEARDHPNANFLAQCLGPEPQVDVDVRGAIPLEAGDRYLVCTDGLYNMVEAPIIATLATMYPVEEAAEKLVALANDRGGYDNISVQILHRADKAPPTGIFEADRFQVLSPPGSRGAGKEERDVAGLEEEVSASEPGEVTNGGSPPGIDQVASRGESTPTPGPPRKIFWVVVAVAIAVVLAVFTLF